MNRLSMGALVAICSLAAAEPNPTIATVSSRSSFLLQGVSVPVAGGISWPVAAGDTIQTNSAPAEIRLRNGTRIIIPAASRFVVGNQNPGKIDLQVNASGSRVPALTTSASSALPAKSVFSMFGADFIAAPPPSGRELGSSGSAPKLTGTTPATLSLAALLQAFGVNSSIVGSIDQAISTKNAIVQFDPASNTFYITGVQAAVGNNSAQTVTFLISPTQVILEPGTVSPGTPPPPPILTVTPGAVLPCKGASLKPADVSNSVISVPTAGSC